MFRIYFTLLILIFSSYSFAKNKPTLTVYTYKSLGPTKLIQEEFETQCQCNLNLIKITGGGMILNRLRVEGKNTQADVIVGLDSNMIDIAKKHNLVQAHNIPKNKDLAIDWWDSDFIPYDYGYFAFVYNQEKIKNPPNTFNQLINNKNNWKIVYQDPRTSTPGLGLLLWINHVYKNDAIKAWEQLAKNTLTVTKSGSEAYGLFLKGEIDFVLSYSTSPAYHLMSENDHRYKAAIFEEGHYSQIEVAAITKFTKKHKLAQQFLNFLLTPKIQRDFAEKNIMYPAIKITLPDAFYKLDDIQKSYQFSSKEVEANKSIWIKQWQESVSK